MNNNVEEIQDDVTSVAIKVLTDDELHDIIADSSSNETVDDPRNLEEIRKKITQSKEKCLLSIIINGIKKPMSLKKVILLLLLYQGLSMAFGSETLTRTNNREVRGENRTIHKKYCFWSFNR